MRSFRFAAAGSSLRFITVLLQRHGGSDVCRLESIGLAPPPGHERGQLRIHDCYDVCSRSMYVCISCCCGDVMCVGTTNYRIQGDIDIELPLCLSLAWRLATRVDFDKEMMEVNK